jgi:type II secretory pathway pseudopilin PulG
MTRGNRPLAAGRAAGFTLVEAALVLLIVGLVVGAIAIPLATRIETNRIESTNRSLDLAQEKLLGFAVKYGYFPCPASETSGGQEVAGADHATGGCNNLWQGFLPAAALGWSPVDAQGYALDAWGNRIRYAVSNATIDGITNPFTRTNGLANAGIGPVGSASLFRICGSGSGVTATDCGGAPTLASNAAVVVWSSGPNTATGGTNIHESQNPNPNSTVLPDNVFVSRQRSGGTDPEFDDIVRWIPGPIVTGKLKVAGMMTPSGSGAGGAGGGGGTAGDNDDDDDDD